MRMYIALKSLVCLGGLFCMTLAAHAATQCGAGDYLDADGTTCVKCENSRYYCPGDNIRYECPPISQHVHNPFPDNYYNPTIRQMENSPYNGAGKREITQCLGIYWLDNPLGGMYEYAEYNPDTRQYDSTTHYDWYYVNAGYYLTDKYISPTCSNNLYYHEVRSCLAGGYCPGQGAMVNNAERCGPDYLPNFGLNVCPDNTYSNAGASVCSPCPAGTGNRGDTLAAHAGVSSCRPLCGAGATKLHAGSYSFNIWSGGSCTSPAINVGLSGGTCCVNLESGAASGLNIKYNGNTYHAVN